MHQLESKFISFIKSNKLLAKGDSVLLAVSGGVDSMVMLDLFFNLKKKLKLTLTVIHVNHQLRGKESDGDEKFVIEKSAQLGIPCICERIDIKGFIQKKKLSKQVGARILRYECFEKTRRHSKSNVVATAHHANDNAETMMLNILRGSGIHGLSGIPLKNEKRKIIRPLLFANKSEIEDYAYIKDVEFRVDSSNNLCDYKRNELRLKIFPILRKRISNFDEKLNAIAFLMSEVSGKLNKLIDKKVQKILHSDSHVYLDLHKLKLEPEFIQDEIFIEILNRLQIETSEKKVEGLKKLASLAVGKILELGGQYLAYRERDKIVIEKRHNKPKEIKDIKFGGSYEFNGIKLSISRPFSLPGQYVSSKSVEFIDADKISGKIILRPWQQGDWFIPLGMTKKKKLSDFFIDVKIPRYIKQSIPILESDGNIIWVCGNRIDDRYKITNKTKKVIKLTYQQMQ